VTHQHRNTLYVSPFPSEQLVYTHQLTLTLQKMNINTHPQTNSQQADENNQSQTDSASSKSVLSSSTQKHSDNTAHLTTEVNSEEESNTDRWVYRDPEGNEQGPFATEDMQRWWFSGFFAPTTEVKLIKETKFGPIWQRKELNSAEAYNAFVYSQYATFYATDNADANGFASTSSSPLTSTTALTSTSYPQWNMYYDYVQYANASVPESSPSVSPTPTASTPSMTTAPASMTSSSPTTTTTSSSSTSEGVPNPGTADTTETNRNESEDNDDGTYTQVAYFNVLTGRFDAKFGASHWDLKNLPTDREGRLMSHYFDVEAYQEMMRRVSQEKNSNPPPRPKVKRKLVEYFKKRKEEKKRKRILNMLL
jgi:hypothetical protein